MQLAVAQQVPGQRVFVDPARDFLDEGALERRQVVRAQCHARGHRVAAELVEQTGMTGGDRVEDVAHVNARHRAGRALDPARLFGGRERNHGPVQSLLDPRRDEPDHALVPAVVVHADAGRHVARESRQLRVELCQRFELHLRFELASIGVELREAPGEFTRRGRIVGQQAVDAQSHVLEASGGVEPRAGLKREVLADHSGERAAGRFEQCPQPGRTATRTDATQPLRHQDAIVEVERHHVGDRAERNEIEQVGRIRGLAVAQPARLPHASRQRRHHVERDAHARQRLRREGLVRRVRIDEPGRFGQFAARQVVIGDEHVDAVAPRLAHAFQRRDAVVDGDDEARLALGRDTDDFGSQAVAEPKAVGHEEVRFEPQLVQLAHHQGGAGGPVCVEVADDQHLQAAVEATDQQVRRLLQAAERAHGQQALEAEIEFQRVAHRTGGVDTAQHRMQGQWQRRDQVGPRLTTNDAASSSCRLACGGCGTAPEAPSRTRIQRHDARSGEYLD